MSLFLFSPFIFNKGSNSGLFPLDLGPSKEFYKVDKVPPLGVKGISSVKSIFSNYSPLFLSFSLIFKVSKSHGNESSPTQFNILAPVLVA